MPWINKRRLSESMVAAEATLSNTFDFLHRVARMKDPHELAQIQSEFVSRQAQVLGDQTTEFGRTIMQGAGEVRQDSQPTRSGMRGQAR
jgi:hypothetical protein